MASRHVEGDREAAFPECRVHDTLWHRRTEEGKVEYLLVPATVRQLEDQAGDILETVEAVEGGEREEAGVGRFSSEETGSTFYGG